MTGHNAEKFYSLKFHALSKLHRDDRFNWFQHQIKNLQINNIVSGVTFFKDTKKLKKNFTEYCPLYMLKSGYTPA